MKTGININTLWSMGVDRGLESMRWGQKVRQQSDRSEERRVGKEC